MALQPHVVLIVESSSIYGRQILAGITRYVRSHSPWSLFFEERHLGAPQPTWLAGWRGDGIITRFLDKELADRLRKNRVPVVCLDDVHEGWGLPSIWSDQLQIGRLAAEHFLERGFRHFAFCGYSGHEWSRQRGLGFTAAVRQAGFGCVEFDTPWGGPGAAPWEEEQDLLGSWLRRLPRPVGVMACNDVRGQRVLDACRRVGVSVPEEVAVIGVDNDEVLCGLCSPPLSSVVPNPERVGYEAATLLDRLKAGEKADPLEVRVEPLGVVTRQSSDVLAIDNPAVAAAVRHIRERACRGLTVDALVRHIPLSRAGLERAFRKYLGRSPQAEIRAVQIKRVKQLLAETDLRLAQIARLAGYTHPEYMSVVFRRETGETPGQYRRKVPSADPFPQQSTARR